MNGPESSSVKLSDAVGLKKSSWKLLTGCSKLEKDENFKTGGSLDKCIDFENVNEEKKQSDPKLTSIIPHTNDKLRDQVREIIAEALCQVSTEGDLNKLGDRDPYRIAASLETILFEKWGRFDDGLEAFKYRSLMFNLRDPGNPDFRRKILLGQLPTYSIVTLTHEEMASDKITRRTQKMKEKAVINLPCFDDWSFGSTRSKCWHHENIRFGLKLGVHDREGPNDGRLCIVCGFKWSERLGDQPKGVWNSVLKRYKRSRLRSQNPT